MKIKPQEGPQTEFLKTAADIAVFGGGAGGGKSFGLILEPLYHFNNPRYGAVIFRRNSTQVRNEGGLWDESMNLYAPLGGKPRKDILEWTFPSKMRTKFAHLENEKTVYDWQGAQITYIGFDELTHFTERQFFYMLSRNRSMSGVPGYIRATCNPDADSWVRKFIDWWIGPDGYPIKERSGKLRWFIRRDDHFIWADTRKELIEKYGADEVPKSVTFIPSLVHDNKILMEKDPSYLSNLRALSRVERLRLLGGNWNVRPTAGMYFQREWFEVIDAIPANVQRVIRYWDKAGSKPSEINPDPDWTVGVKMYKLTNGLFVVADVRRAQETPLSVERMVKFTASHDTHRCSIGIEQEPGSAGVADVGNFTRLLAGYDVRVRKPTTDKETRAKAFSAQCEAGNVKILKAPWNSDYFTELENFPEGAHDDQVDASSGAFNELCEGVSILDVL